MDNRLRLTERWKHLMSLMGSLSQLSFGFYDGTVGSTCEVVGENSTLT
jgi:hypothetical protein